MQSIDTENDELFDNKTACFFTKEYHLVANDLFETLSLPAKNLDQLQQQITQSFNKLKHESGAKPILIGAIPLIPVNHHL